MPDLPDNYFRRPSDLAEIAENVEKNVKPTPGRDAATGSRKTARKRPSRARRQNPPAGDATTTTEK